jgi:hypothetical protein
LNLTCILIATFWKESGRFLSCVTQSVKLTTGIYIVVAQRRKLPSRSQGKGFGKYILEL